MGRQAWQSVSLGRSTCRSACRRCSTSRGRCGARWTSWSSPRPSWAPPPPASVAFYSFLCLSLHCTVPSKISDFMEHKAQFIVAHPCNPPYHTPMVELVPAPWTSTEVFALFNFCIVLPLCAELHNCTLFASQYSVHPALSYIFVGPRWCSRPYGRGWTGSCQPLKGGARLCPQQDAGGENLRQRLTFLDMIFFKWCFFPLCSGQTKNNKTISPVCSAQRVLAPCEGRSCLCSGSRRCHEGGQNIFIVKHTIVMFRKFVNS